MSKRSTTTAAISDQEPRISKRVQQAIALLISGKCKTQKAVCERIGLSESYLSRTLKKDKIRVFLERERSKTIAMGSLRASYRAVELIDSQSEAVSCDATKYVLALNGITPAKHGTAPAITNFDVGYIVNLAPSALKTEGQGHAKPQKREQT
jgi:hypothetical protein